VSIVETSSSTFKLIWSTTYWFRMNDTKIMVEV
jgi:hypothetical protein